MKISKEFRVGLFMIAALVLLYFGFNYLKGIDFFASNYRYYAIYGNVDKLTMSNQIFLNGFAVGRVSDIKILQENGNKVQVELEIDSEIILTDSTVAILTGDFLGNKSITLSGGHGGSHRLEPGDTVKAMLDRGIADILTEKAAPVANNLQVTLRKFNDLVDNLSRNSLELDTLLRGLKGTRYVLNRTLSSADAQINQLGTEFTAVARNLDHVMSDLRPTLGNFKTLSDSLKAVELGVTVKKLQTTLTGLNQTLSQLQKDDNTAGKLFTDRELYDNLNGMILNLDSMVNHLNKNPKHFLAPLGMNRDRIERDLRKQQKEEAKK